MELLNIDLSCTSFKQMQLLKNNTASCREARCFVYPSPRLWDNSALKFDLSSFQNWQSSFELIHFLEQTQVLNRSCMFSIAEVSVLRKPDLLNAGRLQCMENQFTHVVWIIFLLHHHTVFKFQICWVTNLK